MSQSDPIKAKNEQASFDVQALRIAALSIGPDRERYFDSHPLNQRPVKVLTTSIKDAFLSVASAIKFKHPGCAFSARFRSGKSTALLMIQDKLPGEVQAVAFGLITAQEHDAATERVFWGDLLIALRLITEGTAQDRQNRLRTAIISACLQAGGRHFCLLIDEGQNWDARAYTRLRDLANQLREQDGYLLSTVIFGDPRLDDLSANFREKRKDLWARFLMRPEPFFGIRDVSELRYFFAQHDSTMLCEYPAGSGISYTEFFLPSAYESGWRLANQAQYAWDAFVRAATEIGQEISDIAMQWVGDTVIHFLITQMKNDVVAGFNFQSAWDDAVKDSRFIDSLV